MKSPQKKQEEKLSPAKVLRDPRLYVLYWTAENGITVSPRGELKDPIGRHTIGVFNSMYLDYKEQVRKHNAIEAQKAPNQRDTVAAVAEKDLSKALSERIDLEVAEFRRKRAETLACQGENLEPLKKLVRAVTGDENPVHVGVMAHWLWLVKRKFLGRPVSYHIMPILFGPQGSGKTVALTKLLAPISNWQLNIKMNQLGDERYYVSMSQNFVVLFDEMQGVSRVDVDVLKNQMTADTNDSRILGTHTVVKVPQSCSFIGATNKPISEQILDTTGMRRFFQIDTLDKVDWEAINSIDYEELWVGIDESKSRGYIEEHLEAIQEIQAEMTAIDPIDQFIQDFRITPPTQKSEKFVLNTDVYEAYRRWCEDNGINRPLDSMWLGRRLGNKGFKSEMRRLNKRTVRGYSLKGSCRIQAVG